MLGFAFMQRALLAGLIVGLLSPLVGTFLVLRRLSFYGDTLAHVSLAGVASGLLLRVYPPGVGLAFSVAASVGMERLRRSYSRYSELAAAITMVGSLGLAVIVMDLAGGMNNAYLFGSLMTVSVTDLWLIGFVGLLVLGVLLLLYKEWLFLTFDEELAEISGLPVGRLNHLFAILVGLTVALSMRVVGVFLVSALMVVPVAAALQLGRSFRSVLTWSVVLSELSVVGGLALSYGLDLPPGGTIAVTTVLLLGLVFLAKRLGQRRRPA